MTPGTGYVPYCGAPPTPGALEWNLDPVLLAVLFALLACYWAGGRKAPDRDGGPGCRTAFLVGWAIAFLALVSPLCHLSVALFSARVGQHLFLTLLAAPLIAVGRPGLILLAFAPRDGGLRLSGASGGMFAAPVFALTLWAWHLPGPYDLTLASDLAYWAMHISLFGSALWLWRTLLDSARPLLGIVAGLGTAIQMGLLGAVLTFASSPLFDDHQATTWPWGLTPLQDQQLGGLLMWAPGGILFAVGAVAILGLWLRSLSRRGMAGG